MVSARTAVELGFRRKARAPASRIAWEIGLRGSCEKPLCELVTIEVREVTMGDDRVRVQVVAAVSGAMVRAWCDLPVTPQGSIYVPSQRAFEVRTAERSEPDLPPLQRELRDLSRHTKYGEIPAQLQRFLHDLLPQWTRVHQEPHVPRRT